MRATCWETSVACGNAWSMLKCRLGESRLSQAKSLSRPTLNDLTVLIITQGPRTYWSSPSFTRADPVVSPAFLVITMRLRTLALGQLLAPALHDF